MAKNGTKTTIAIVSLVITATVIGVGLVAYAVTNSHQTDDTAEDLDALKIEGCNPAKELAISVAVIDTKLENIKEDVAESRVEQRADTKAILEAITENK